LADKKYMAIDVGLKRVGVAISLAAQLVTPISPVIRKNRNQASKEIKELLKEWSIDTLVVGLPDGEEMRARIRHFVKLIEFDSEIVYQDESFSSRESSTLMAGVTKNKKDGKSDSISAMIILERFFDIVK
jgi:putative Holliday junction resolvase